jgi:GxxExxY protein
MRGVPFERQVPLRVTYKGYSIGEGRADYVVDGQVVVELKTVEAIVPIHVAQVLSYLRASALTLGLLINFNTSLLRQGIRRVVLSRP